MSFKKPGFVKKSLAVLLALLVLLVSAQIFKFIIPIVGAMALTMFDVHISEDERALRNLEAFSNIATLVIAVYLSVKMYKRTVQNKKTPTPIDTPKTE